MQMRYVQFRLDKSRMQMKDAEFCLDNLHFRSPLLILAVNGSMEI